MPLKEKPVLKAGLKVQGLENATTNERLALVAYLRQQADYLAATEEEYPNVYVNNVDIMPQDAGGAVKVVSEATASKRRFEEFLKGLDAKNQNIPG